MHYDDLVADIYQKNLELNWQQLWMLEGVLVMDYLLPLLLLLPILWVLEVLLGLAVVKDLFLYCRQGGPSRWN